MSDVEASNKMSDVEASNKMSDVEASNTVLPRLSVGGCTRWWFLK